LISGQNRKISATVQQEDQRRNQFSGNSVIDEFT
jgi:hypothetical protein